MNFQVNNSKRKKIAGLEDHEHTEDEHVTSLVDGRIAAAPISASVPVISNSINASLVIPLPATFGSHSMLEDRAAKEIMSEINGGSTFNNSKTLRISLQPETGVGVISDFQTAKARPLLLSNLPSELLGVMDDDVRFKKDISLRANDIPATSNAYNAIPIHEFGAAMLRGMGWAGTSDEEQAILDKKYTEPIMARESRVGLGATAKPPSKDSRGIKAKVGKEKWMQMADEKVKSQQLSEGQLVWIRDPLYAGRRAVILASQGVPGLERIRVTMESDATHVELKKSDVVVLTEKELLETPYQGVIPSVTQGTGTGTEESTTESKASSSDSRKRSTQEVRGEENKKRHKHEKKVSEKRDESWVRPGIRVRVVSKKVGGSIIYLQKATVIDSWQGVASIKLDHDGSIVEDVNQKHLETVLPSTGQPIIVLVGEYAGQSGLLLEKQKEQENVIVQLSDDMQIVVVPMDHCAALSTTNL